MKSPRRVLLAGRSAHFDGPGRARTRSARPKALALALAFSVLSLVAQGCAHHHAHGHHHHRGRHGMPGVAGISVVGVGEVKAAPDIARTNVGVEARAPQAEQAVAEANQRMARVLAALKAAGVADGDLRTHSLSIHFERDHQPPPPPMPVEATRSASGKAGASAEIAAAPAPAPEGFYRVSNMVEVTVRNLDRISQVLAAATSAGVNQMWGISFEVADPSPLIAQARAKAVEQAKQNAEQLQQLTGVALGPIVAITDGALSQGPVTPMFAARAEMASTSMPVERGELTVTHQVTILYGLVEAGGSAREQDKDGAKHAHEH